MRRWLGLGAVLVLALGVFLFEPWALFQDSTVDERRPAPASSVDTEVRELAPAAAFVAQEHPTSGTASILGTPDGGRTLRLEGFSTTNGPDLHVWLSAETAGGNWFKYRNARHIELGELKANNGNQNYEIPAAAELDGIHSVVIWCKRFSVAFGSAPISLG
jgi:hypothetical protein